MGILYVKKSKKSIKIEKGIKCRINLKEKDKIKIIVENLTKE